MDPGQIMNQFDIPHLRQAQIDAYHRKAERLRAQALRDGIAMLGRAVMRLVASLRLAPRRQPAR